MSSMSNLPTGTAAATHAVPHAATHVPALDPASSPAHPQHKYWVAKLANALLETGVLVLASANHIEVSDGK